MKFTSLTITFLLSIIHHDSFFVSAHPIKKYLRSNNNDTKDNKDDLPKKNNNLSPTDNNDDILLQAWTKIETKPEEENEKNNQNPEKKNRKKRRQQRQKISIDHDRISQKLLQVKRKDENGKGGIAKLRIDMMEENNDDDDTEVPPVDCDLEEFSVMSPEMADKYPNIISTSGRCSNGMTAVFTIDTKIKNSFHGYMVRDYDGAQFVVDRDDDDDDAFIFSRVKETMAQKSSLLSTTPWTDSVMMEEDETNDEEGGRPSNRRERRDLTTSGNKAYKFRIAIMTT